MKRGEFVVILGPSGAGKSTLLNLLGVDVGDKVKMHIKGSNKWVDIKIDKIEGNPSSQGLIMSTKKLEDLGLNYTTTSIITKKHVKKHVKEDYEGVKSTIYRQDMIDSAREVKKPLWIIIYALMFFAVVLALIVLYNLGLLSFVEMERDLGTLKVLGFKTRALTKLLLTQSLVFIIMGILIGIPIGYRILVMIWQSSSEKYYIASVLSLTNIFSTLLIILAVSIVINIFFSYKIKRLDMVEALKILE